MMKSLSLLLFLLVLLSAAVPTGADDPVYLSIPSLDMHQPVGFVPIVNYDWDTSRLGRGVGFLALTAQFGEAGNIMIAGHNYGVFRSLDQLDIGDEITLAKGDRVIRYVVVNMFIRDDNSIDFAYWTPNNQLTLITCVGSSLVMRLIVVAVEYG